MAGSRPTPNPDKTTPAELQKIIEEINQNYIDLDSPSQFVDKKEENRLNQTTELFNDIPIRREDIWWYGMDAKDQARGDPYYFDKPREVIEAGGKTNIRSEPGYKPGMEKALLLMFRTLDFPLTVELIVAFHDMAISTVEKLRDKKGIRDSYNTFEIVKDVNASYEGMTEILSNYQAFCRFQDLKTLKIAVNPETCFKQRHQKVDLWHPEKTPAKVKEFFSQFVEDYKIKIAEAKTDFEKIFAIADFIHKCEILHPFMDGNIRTLAFTLGNRLLLENGLPPAIFNDPNRFDGCSTLQLCGEIINGMKTTSFAYKERFPFTKELQEAEKQIKQEIDAEKKLLAIERKIRTTNWPSQDGGSKITIDSLKTQKIVPPIRKQQWEIIQEAISRKKPFSVALKEVQVLGAKVLDKNRFFPAKSNLEHKLATKKHNTDRTPRAGGAGS